MPDSGCICWGQVEIACGKPAGLVKNWSHFADSGIFPLVLGHWILKDFKSHT